MGPEPFCTASGGRVIDRSLERGLGYLARVSTDGAAALAQSLGDDHAVFLWITSRSTAPLSNGGTELCVATASRLRGVDPKRLGDMRASAAAFLDSHPGGVLILDCLDLLATHNGVERVVRAIEGIHDDATTKGGTLVVFADPRTASPRLIAWLERELEDFPVAISDAALPDVLVA